jgi:DNA-binding winged helix-turn-helix (wHTH) protein/Tfp pilus assembly protein PilF/TolB-like protein
MGVLRFGAFTLDRPGRAVLRDGAQVELRSQSFDVLDYLAGNAGRVVSKDELIDAVWDRKPANEDSLVQCIADIRRALGDSDHRLIRTLPRKGYMFVAQATEVAPGEVARVQQSQAPAARPQAAADATRQSLVIAACLLVVLLAGTGWLVWSWARPAVLTMMAEPSIVLLPVRPLGDESDKALANLPGEIATGIWRAPRGFKPNIRPANGIKDAGRDPKAIGRETGARYVVRTAARREGEVLHVNIEVIEAESGWQVWLGAFEYRPGEQGAQYRAAARIGRTLAAEILRTETRRPLPARVEAGHFVMLGRSLMNDERSAKTNGEAIALFEKAIAMDGKNFMALGHFARASADHIMNGWAPQSERAGLLAKAEEAVNEAIKLEPKSAAAFLTRGGVLRARGDYQQAIAAFNEALSHNPNFANAYAELGLTMIDVGQPEKTAELVQKALDINPDDFARYIWLSWAGVASLYLDQPGEALKWLRQSHEANRQYDNTLRLMAVAYAHAGDETEARKKMDEFRRKRRDATLDDWMKPDVPPHPNIAKQRARIHETMKRLGLPEGKVKAASTP